MPIRCVPIIFATLGSLSSCARGDCRADWIRLAFTDFTYIGEHAADASKPLPRHGTASVPLPKQLKVGVAYVFHTKEQLTTEEAALRLLPRKLRDAGVEILDAPKNSGEFAVPNSGGPRWNIRFRRNGCQGELYNVVDPALYGSRSSWPPGSRDDYVLMLRR
jgi:hypothetical protein